MSYSGQNSQQDQLSVSSSLHSILSPINLGNAVTEFRAKVDRRLLEAMLSPGNGFVESAKDFFSRASSQSGAIISFPQMSKLQCMPKKDPEVRIIGNPSQIRLARKMIMDVMEPNRNRVVLKIDVSFADHSFIIGKGGKRIQSIMSATQTQIHFPDENLVNPDLKSNVVTITSDSLRKADEARQTIRKSLPLTISFMVVVDREKLCLLDSKHPLIEYYQRTHSVIINFKCIETTESSVTANIQIRGNRHNIDQLDLTAQALNALMDSSGYGISSKVFTIRIEIAPRHQSYVMGLNKANVKSITNRTGAIISFPDLETSNSVLAAPDSSTVTVRGVGIETVFLAWLQLLEYLPVMLLFDIKVTDLNCRLFTDLMANQFMSVKICPKIGDSHKRTVLLKVKERDISLLFEARKQILAVDEEPQTICLTNGSSHLLSDWNQRFAYLTSMSPLLPEVMDSELEVSRSELQ